MLDRVVAGRELVLGDQKFRFHSHAVGPKLNPLAADKDVASRLFTESDSMALHFDIRIAGEGTRLSAIFVRRGLSVEYGSSWLLPRLVGMSHAMDLALTGRIIGAQEALAMGLVSRIVPDGQLLETAIGMAREIAVYCSPMAMAEAKRMLWQHLTADFRIATDDSTAIMSSMSRHSDFKEGVMSFVEKRTPRFLPV